MSELTADMVRRGPGAVRSDDTDWLRLKRDMRSTRERLTSSSGLERAFDYELLRLFAQQGIGASLATSLLAFCIAGVALIWLPFAIIPPWLTLSFITIFVSLTLSRRFLRQPIESVRLPEWRGYFVLSQALIGTSWMIVVAMLLMSGEDNARLLVLLVVLLVSAMTAMLSFSVPAAVYATLLPIGLSIGATAAWRGEVAGLFPVLGGLSGQLYFLLLAHRQYQSAVATLEFRAEKDALIAELEQAKANSDEARRRAEEANLAKSRFLATMSHELRTPLNAILGFSELMKNEILGPLQIPAYKEYVTDIHGSGQHLLNLINEILDLSRIEAGRYELKEEAISIAAVVEDCCHLLKLRAKNRGQAIAQRLEDDLPRIWADERAIRQVALNLLSNAIKFTPQGGSIVIKCGWTAGGGQYISVRDTGPGIPDEEIPVVLSTFGRGSLAIKTAEQGSGLGLPIVKGLIDLHGGTFRLTSKLREGTEVIVTLPPQRVIDALAPVTVGARAQAAAA